MEKTPQEKLEAFFEKKELVKYRDKERILRAGEPIFGVFFLRKGLVRQFSISEDGEEVTIHLYRSGSFFPFMLLVNNYPNSFDYEAITHVEIIREDPEELFEFIKNNSDVLLATTKRFADAIAGLSERVKNLAVGDSHQKTVQILKYLAKSFGETSEKGTLINLPLTQSDLAAWIGVRRETISRSLKKLSGEGFLLYKKSKIILLPNE
jgi:CRP/FNR family transcriptional regulator